MARWPVATRPLVVVVAVVVVVVVVAGVGVGVRNPPSMTHWCTPSEVKKGR